MERENSENSPEGGLERSDFLKFKFFKICFHRAEYQKESIKETKENGWLF